MLPDPSAFRKPVRCEHRVSSSNCAVYVWSLAPVKFSTEGLLSPEAFPFFVCALASAGHDCAPRMQVRSHLSSAKYTQCFWFCEDIRRCGELVSWDFGVFVSVSSKYLTGLLKALGSGTKKEIGDERFK